MCVLVSALCAPSKCQSVYLSLARSPQSHPLQHYTCIRPAKLSLSLSVGPAGEKQRKDLFHCFVNHCFISTLLSPSLRSDISQGCWPPFKCEHNTAIEIMVCTSWPELGSAGLCISFSSPKLQPLALNSIHYSFF